MYDLDSDEYEFKNLAKDPKLAPIKARLAQELALWMAQQGDKGLPTELNASTRQGGKLAEGRDPKPKAKNPTSKAKKKRRVKKPKK